MLRFTSSALFKSVAVWGGGTMGSGIAQVTAQASIPVTLVDVSQARLDASRKAIENTLLRVAKKQCNGDQAKMKSFVDIVVSHITFTTDETLAAAGAELVIEAIVENIDAKKELFSRIDKMAPKSTAFCSNTSSLSVKELAAATTRKDRFAGAHFFSPVSMMKLVEVVRTDDVKPEVIEQLVSFGKVIGKAPVVAKDTEGFIVNRLLVPYQLEACRLVERGVATFQDVDIAMKYGCGYPMGPFELCDSVGIDVLKFIVDGWHKQFPEEPLFKPSKLIDDAVQAGKLGKKTGEGFYKYDSNGRRVE
ncbi:putative short chain 3-hydroxyacyl-CoA dehydrogenase [Leptomonas pyrrhocoris]|uniref:Putative short chain 3-hydroxyacyl-CoA dehydrogenase n=1 Tax=Leptomonas pyrrhocoris TaxID=157538 RepID=A0A0N0DVE7_LEPPY|nr:putative short chain 3-hydroxyacyl-CoA dehydrogenase [Leptomonas pyrrhocoris]XP_015658444.1 putative short chain 3-hydroxyacyl-CoA dehydrogenase [Leptomonas pyrrhocoris]KPA80004.1 putative short chain 3-hydroxyacyl-CoA dehydrogenase [Leptomonas pyrrhocoris]KPA80005.1 putative short chain 3-hydroxyacyl-CoA dehydrogenase [Leptomonas pyrrhocoris]|eukprot:XP_015658443.1 putative short chain 3-hydroxyacyl-CoA dehydrogenase [Leptomonas pyrrhocoris]